MKATSNVDKALPVMVSQLEKDVCEPTQLDSSNRNTPNATTTTIGTTATATTTTIGTTGSTTHHPSFGNHPRALSKPSGLSLRARLPFYNGPLTVGVVDIETAPETQPTPTRPGMPVRHGLLARIYYPANITATSSGDQKAVPSSQRGLSKRTQPLWLPPNAPYAAGLADFLKLSWVVSRGVVQPVLNPIVMPAVWQAELAPATMPTDKPSGHGDDSNRIHSDHPTSNKLDLPTRLPVVVLSHGLAGMRTTYSTICGSLAAKGFIVIAPEHSDGSASATSRHVPDPDNKAEGPLSYTHILTIPYLRPEESHLGPDETMDAYLLRLRNLQVEIRADEVMDCIQLLQQIDSGAFNPDTNIIGDTGGPCVTPLADFKTVISSLKGRMDFTQMVMAGHSFGGATAITALSRPANPFKCGLFLDPWMFPVKNPNVIVPFLNIQSETFNWRENLDAMRALMGLDPITPVESPPSPDHNGSSGSTDPLLSSRPRIVHTPCSNVHSQSRFGYLRDTIHTNASDFAGLFPTLSRWIGQSGKADPLRVYRINDEWLTEFARTYLTTTALRLPQFEEFAVCCEYEDDLVVMGDRAWKDLYGRLK
ncbi:hypothetical protein BASA61_006633 [Batrachochytrium salamandrivorans]|nr:hypothetical protein BASA61_006633 [Batrachochytrium salamandrivorans]